MQDLGHDALYLPPKNEAFVQPLKSTRPVGHGKSFGRLMVGFFERWVCVFVTPLSLKDTCRGAVTGDEFDRRGWLPSFPSLLPRIEPVEGAGRALPVCRKGKGESSQWQVVRETAALWHNDCAMSLPLGGKERFLPCKGLKS
jgi:hypothetical protein